jgi:tRNA pseudouridine55 synthase
LVDKPAGISSFAALARLRRRYGRKIGHAGTLDPFATGLLLVLVGRATRLAPHLVGLDKTYEGTVRFGVRSTTEDPEGTLSPSGLQTTARAIEAALPGLTGEIDQIPPAASAVHIDGERAYRRFRRGEEVTVPPRRVRVHRFELMHFDSTTQEARIVVDCGTGTYIRSLARDLGDVLGCGAYLSALRRTSVGPFDVSAAATPDGILDSAAEPLRDPLDAVPALRRVTLDATTAARVTHGSSVIDDGPDGIVALVAPDGCLMAIGEANDGVVQPRTVLTPA